MRFTARLTYLGYPVELGERTARILSPRGELLFHGVATTSLVRRKIRERRRQARREAENTRMESPRVAPAGP